MLLFDTLEENLKQQFQIQILTIGFWVLGSSCLLIANNRPPIANS
jgi:hypothetical protein